MKQLLLFANKHHRYIELLLFFAVICLIRFYPILFQDKTFFFGDNYSLQVPDRLFTVYWLKQGILPLWNPLTLSGITWVGDISQALFYPSTILYWLFAPADALSLTIMIHIFILFVGTYLLIWTLTKNHLGAILGSVIFSMSTAATGSSNNLVTIQSMSWIPWLVNSSYSLAQTRHASIKTGFILAILILASYPQYLILALLPALVVSYLGISQVKQKVTPKALLTRLVLRWILTIIIAIGFCAVSLLPFVVTLLNSTRTIQTVTQSAMGSLRMPELIKMIVPYVFDAPAYGIKWGPVWSGFPTALPYITTTGLIILFLNIKRMFKSNRYFRFMSLVAAMSFILALGNNLPFYNQLLTAIPILTMVRYPSMWLTTTHLMLVIMLALALPTIKVNRRLCAVIILLASIGLISALLILIYVQINPQSLWHNLNSLLDNRLAVSPFHTLARDTLIIKMITIGTILTAVFTGLSIWLLYKKRTYVFIIVASMEVILASQTILMYGPKSNYPDSTRLQSALASNLIDQQARTLTRNMNRAYTDFGTYWEAYYVRPPFSDSFIDAKEMETGAVLKRMRDGLTPDWHEVAGVPIMLGYTTLMPKDYAAIWSTSNTEARINYLPQVDIDNPKLKDWAVKYYVVDRWFAVDEDYSKLKKIYSDEDWDIYELPNTKNRFRYEDDTPVDLSEFQENPNQIRMTINNQNHQYLIVADRYDVGWQAKINGVDTTLTNFNGMRQIKLVPGQNEIILTYLPTTFVIGSIISIITISTIMIYLAKTKINNRKKLLT